MKNYKTWDDISIVMGEVFYSALACFTPFVFNLQMFLISLDETFSQPCVLNKELSRNLLKRCEELFRGIDNGKVMPVKVLHNLMTRGVKLLINSCRPYSHDVHSVAMKVLYLSDIVIKRFRKTIIEHKDMVSNREFFFFLKD